MALLFVFLRNTCSTFSLSYWLPGKKSMGKGMEALRKGGELLYFFSESEALSWNHMFLIFLGFQKKQQASGCSSLKVVEFHMVQSTICSRYSRIHRLVLAQYFLYFTTCVLQLLNNYHFSCHSNQISSTLKWDLRIIWGFEFKADNTV